MKNFIRKILNFFKKKEIPIYHNTYDPYDIEQMTRGQLSEYLEEVRQAWKREE